MLSGAFNVLVNTLTDPHPAGHLEKLNMDVKDYDQNFNRDPSNLLAKIDLANPERIVVEDKSIHQLMRQYMSAQSDTSSRLIDFIGQRITTEVEIDGHRLSVVEQQRELSEIANKSTLLSRQMEKLLDERNKLQKGVDYENEKLINEPPMSTFGQEAKVSDTGLRMIVNFSGDNNESVEEDLTVFLRDVFSLVQTNNLTEKASISVILRKLTGSAQVLIDTFIEKAGGIDEVTFRQLVSHLEKKFVIRSSPLHAENELHQLSKQNLSFTQLQAKIQRLVRLACRLEEGEKKLSLIDIKEKAAFIMSIDLDDRLLVNAENNRRALEALPPLSLDQMSTFLTKAMADKLKNEPIYTVQDSAQAPINNVQRGAFRGRNRFQRPTTHQKFQNDSKDQHNPRGQVKNGRFQRGPRQSGGLQRKFVTSEMANVPPHTCLLCGQPGHTFRDETCIYAGCELKQSPCRWCNFGAHPHDKCRNKSTK